MPVETQQWIDIGEGVELAPEDYIFVWDEEDFLNEESELEEWQLEEVTACTLDCRYFIENFAWIERKETREILQFIPYDWQWDILERLQNGESIVINKSRRVGVSWIVAAYTAWLINFSEGAHVLFLSKTEKDAIKLLRKVKFILNNLTFRDADNIRDATSASFLRGEVETDNQQYFSIKYRNDDGTTAVTSQAESLTMTIDAGRSEGATVVFWDEAAFAKPDDEATWTAVVPTTTRGGQIIVASTPNGVGGVHWQLVRDGEQGENDWYHFSFVHWSESGITQAQVDRVRKALKMTNETYLQEFEGKFIQPGTRVFDAVYLDACYRQLELYPEVADELQRYDLEHGLYYSAADSATGEFHKNREPDENAFVALTYSGIVAHVEHNRILLGDWAGKGMSDGSFKEGVVSKLHKEWPGILYIEKKGPGDTVLTNYLAPEDGVSQMYPVDPNEKTIPRIFEQLILAVEGQKIIITSRVLYNQMYDIQRGNRPGKYEPPSGGNDDVLLAAAWAWDALCYHGGLDLPEAIKTPDPNRQSVTGQFAPVMFGAGHVPGTGVNLKDHDWRATDTIIGPGQLPVPIIRVPAPQQSGLPMPGPWEEDYAV